MSLSVFFKFNCFIVVFDPDALFWCLLNYRIQNNKSIYKVTVVMNAAAFL